MTEPIQIHIDKVQCRKCGRLLMEMPEPGASIVIYNGGSINFACPCTPMERIKALSRGAFGANNAE